MTHVSKKIRVLMVGQVPPPMGGVTEQVRLLLHSALDQRVDLVHVSPQRTTECRGLGRIWNSLRLILQVIIRCLVRAPDVAHLHTSSHLGFHEKAVLARILSVFGARVVIHLHGGGFAEFYRNSRRPSWIRGALERADAVLVLSSSWKTYLMKIAPRARVEVFQNSIDVSLYAPKAPDGRVPRKAHERIGLINAGPPKVLFLGALVPEKGIFKLLEIARHFDPSEAVFEIVGEGPEAGRLAAAIPDSGLDHKVQWKGPRYGAEKIAALQDASIFLLPSDVEGQPVSILEAMASRAAVVSSDVGGIPELLADGRGIVCARNDVRAYVDAIRGLLRGDASRREMVEKAFVYVQESHDLPGQIERLVAIYRRLIDPGPAPDVVMSSGKCPARSTA